MGVRIFECPEAEPHIDHVPDVEVQIGPYAFIALSLHQRGWWPIPLKLRGKPPAVSGFSGAQGQPVSAADVSRWSASALARGNVGVRLPRDIVGIDVDAYDGRPGAKTLIELQGRLGPLPATVRVTSRTDGESGIRLFKLPDGTDEARARAGWAGIEVIRFGHRHVVVPPSVHPEGRTYVAVHEATGELLDVLPRPAEIPELPPAWVEELLSRPDPAERPAVLAPGGTPCAAVVARLGSALGALVGGEARHDVAVREALALVRLGDQGHTGVDTALGQLGAVFVASVSDARANRRTAEHEWTSAVDSARARISESPTPEEIRRCCRGSQRVGDSAWRVWSAAELVVRR